MAHRFSAPRKTWFSALLLILLCAALFGPGLGSSTTSRQQELRVLLCARDMAEGGDWVVPHFLGQERLRKPPLMYWLTALAFRAAGTTESLGAARAVSSASATALVLACFLLGRRLMGRRAAFLGALVLATSLGFLYHGRLAETDMPQSLFCSLTLFMLYEALVGGRPAAWLLAGLSAGLGFMIKGPASLAMPVAAALTYALVTRRIVGPAPASRPTRKVLTGVLLALAVGACIAAPWYALVAARTASTGSQVSNEMTRLLAESSHDGPLVFYFYTLPARMGIWGLAVPVAVFAAWKLLRHHRGPRWILCWLGSSFLILSALSSKQNHYALLLLPPAALLTGWLLSRARVIPKRTDRQTNARKRLSAFCATFARNYLRLLLGLLALAGAAGTLAWLLKLPQPLPLLVPAMGTAAFALCLMMLRRQQTNRASVPAAVTVAAAVALGIAGYFLGVEGMFNGDSLIPDMIRAHRSQVQAAGRLLVCGDHRAPVEWYAHRRCVFVPPLAAGALDQLKAGEVLFASEKKDPLRPRPNDPAPLDRRRLGDVEAAIYVK